ncbi:MAG: GIY-YIG nuclease family protein [Planctomycetes bacterium]|nr:GIY-YIG nuclease family protein [Planctomycetota bacterium]
MTTIRKIVLDAFLEVCDGYAPDRVIADPEMNARFLSACHRVSDFNGPQALNQCLLNLRKASGLAGAKCKKRTQLENQESYAFASEIAVRSLEIKHKVSLDVILCDPILASEFDSVALEIAPGYTPFHYRWAALGLRKTRKLKPEILARVVTESVVGPIKAIELDLNASQGKQGVYILTSRQKVLYVGEARNLRLRLRTHLEHSDNKFLARYLWEFGLQDLFIEIHVLPNSSSGIVRRALELELIRSRRPEFNVNR